MDTKTLLLTDILNCGYADLDMLDIVYSPLADEINLDREDILRNADDINYIIDRTYCFITSVITDRLYTLIEEYTNSLDEEGNITSDTEICELSELLEDIVYKRNEEGDKFIGLTTEQLTIIKDKIEEMEDSYPYCNYLDSHFQNDLDQTLDEEVGVDDNCKFLLEYWLK